MTLRMLAFQPDFGRLGRLAARERLLPPGDDLGYAVHAVFAASFAEAAPKPFAVFPPGAPGGGPAGRLLAYSSHALDDLRRHAARFAAPAFSTVLDLDSAGEKLMPEAFAPGIRLGFKIRVRPVARTGKGRDGAGARERDAFLAECEGAATPQDRAQVYAAWLAMRLAACGARLEQAALDGFRLTRVLARDRGAESTRPRAPAGPDATLAGTLAVTEPEAFHAALARGIGRHRAFGFGMLLLTPPKR